MHETLYQSPQLAVFGQDFPSDVLIVSFSPFGFKINGESYSEDGFFEKAKLASLGIVAPQPGWFPQSHVAPAIPAILAAANGRRIITWGAGQGGYGALKYGKALGAFAALAFNPHSTIDPAVAGPFDPRFARFFDKTLQNGAAITGQDLCPANYLIYDPYEAITARHAALIAAAGGAGVHKVIVPLAKDAAARMIQEANQGSALFTLLAAAAPPPAAAVRQVLRASRQGSAGYLTARIAVLRRMRPNQPARAERLAEALPEGQRAIQRLKILLADARPDEALEILKSIPAPRLRQAGLPGLLKLFRDAKFTAGELHIAPLLQTQYAANPKEYLKTADIYLRAGRQHEAMITLLDALKIPAIGTQIETLMAYAIRLQRDEVYEPVLDLLLRDPAMTEREKIIAGVKFAAQCQAAGARNISVRCLRMLRDFHNPDIGLLDMIAKGLEDVQEKSMALDIRLYLLEQDPKNISRQLNVILLYCALDKTKAREMLPELLTRQDLPVEAWETISLIQNRLGDPQAAQEATNNALKAGADKAASHLRLATLHLMARDDVGVQTEIRQALAMPDIGVTPLRAFAGIAIKMDNKELALACALRQYKGREAEPDACLYFIQFLIDIDEHAAATDLVMGILNGTSGLRPFKPNEWLWCANQVARLARGDLELRVIEMGRQIFPGDKPLLAHQREIRAKQKLLGAITRHGSTAPPKQKSPLRRLFSFAFSST